MPDRHVAITNRDSGLNSDLGLGNHTGTSLGWTFAANAKSNSMASLRVLVRVK